MLEIKSKLKVARAVYKVEIRGQLKLPFETAAATAVPATPQA